MERGGKESGRGRSLPRYQEEKEGKVKGRGVQRMEERNWRKQGDRMEGGRQREEEMWE